MVASVNVRKVAIILIALQCLGISPSYGATTKPKPKVESTKHVAKKKVVSKKAVSKKVASKKTVSKKVVSKPRFIYHKPEAKKVPAKAKIKWPPAGFTSIGTAYARVPTGEELVEILSAKSDPTDSINSCALDPNNPNAVAYACAAVLVGATNQCTWWRVSSTMTGIDPADATNRIILGDLTTYVKGAEAKTIQTVFLVSPIPLQTGIRFTAIHALCGIGPSTAQIPSTVFTAAPSTVPTASPSPSNSQ